MAAWRIGWLVLVAALWMQLYVACIYGWRFGEYYAYGWYVPPLVGLFAWRIRGHFTTRDPAPLSPWFLAAAGLLLGAALFALRVVERVDPRWTLPIWIQAGFVVAVTLFAAQRLGGARGVRRAVPILVFACSAIPLPSVVEAKLVHGLTHSVVTTSTVVLGWLGHAAESVGDQIASRGEVVRVTEGCSGIRSAQSFLMASLFFGEWMQLRTGPRVLLLVAGFATAWLLNVARATTLAVVHFDRGSEAMDAIHDSAGLLAFFIGSAILYFLAGRLDAGRPGQRIRRTRVERGTA